MSRPLLKGLSIGTDICHIPRIMRLLTISEGKFAYKLMNRLLNAREREDAAFVHAFLPNPNDHDSGYSDEEVKRVGKLLNRGLLPKQVSKNRVISDTKFYLKRYWDVDIPPTHPNRTGSKTDGENMLDGEKVEPSLSTKDSNVSELLDILNQTSSAPQAALDVTSEELKSKAASVIRTEVEARGNIWRLASFLAGRWAAKEAVIKANRGDRLLMHDITILKGGILEGRSFPPRAFIRLHNGSDSLQSKDNTVDELEVNISISHDGAYATAVCMIAPEPREEDREDRLERLLESIESAVLRGGGGTRELAGRARDRYRMRKSRNVERPHKLSKGG